MKTIERHEREPLMGRLTLVAALVALSALTGCSERPVTPIDVESPRTFAWPAEALEATARIPAQHGGRVKPLSTLAGFSLMKLNGKRSVRLPEETGLPTGKEKLDPVAWLLDVWFFPKQADQYEVFLVEDSGVLQGVGLRFENRKRRDRYSYSQLAPARDKILEAYRSALQRQRDGLDLSNIDRQSKHLFERMIEYEALAGTLDFVRLPVPGGLPQELVDALGDDLYKLRSRRRAHGRHGPGFVYRIS